MLPWTPPASVYGAELHLSAHTLSWWVNASSLAAVRRSWSGGGAVARVTWAGTAWKLALILLVDGHGRPGGIRFLRGPASLHGLCWDVIAAFCRMLVGHCYCVGRTLYGGTFGARHTLCLVRAGEVYFYGKLFGGTRPVVVGGVKRFWDHNRYHISSFGAATVITLSVLDTKGSVSSVPGTLSAVVTAGDDMAACLVYSPLPSDGLVVRFFVGRAASTCCWLLWCWWDASPGWL